MYTISLIVKLHQEFFKVNTTLALCIFKGGYTHSECEIILKSPVLLVSTYKGIIFLCRLARNTQLQTIIEQ